MKILMSLVVALFLMGVRAAGTEAGDCDGLVGAESGLCKAYCENMNCDGDYQASEKACEKVKEAYIKLTEQPPPCWVPDPINCPAWTELDFEYATECISQASSSNYYIEDYDPYSGQISTLYIGQSECWDSSVGIFLVYNDSNPFSGFPAVGGISTHIDGVLALFKDKVLTQEEYAICLDQIKLAIGIGN